MHSHPSFVKNSFKLGASGYLTKNSPGAEIFASAVEVMKGKRYICAEVKSIMSSLRLDDTDEQIPRIEELTPREIGIIRLIKTGLASREIATMLGLSTRTVEVHRYNMFRKLKLKNSAALVNFINNTDLNFG